MMNRTFASIFAVLCVISILEVTTFNSKEAKAHDENSHDEFREFDDDSSFEYSKKANEEEDVESSTHAYNTEDGGVGNEDIEIRQPTGMKSTSFKVPPLDLPPVRFTYCVSCGYRQAFDQMSQILHDKYPGILIEGSNYPPTQIKALLAQFIGFSKIALIVMIIIGRDPFSSLGMATPSFFTWMLANKLSSCLMLFMLSNSVEGMLMSTGAFEIHIGEEQIWSKLESGRPPSPAELVQAIDSHLTIRGSKLASASAASAASGGASSSFGFDGVEH